MRYILVFLAIVAVSVSKPELAIAQNGSEGIAVVVNEDAITVSDVNDRMQLVMVSSRMPNRPDVIEKIKPQVLVALVDEQLKLQEAERLELDVTQEEIDSGFAQLAQQNNVPADEFKNMIQQSGVNISTMYRQIKSQMAWAKVVQKEIRPKITVSDADVDDGLRRLQDIIGTSEYRVAEIYLPFEGSKNTNDVAALARTVTDDIRAGRAPFFRVAQQLSKSAGASDGGNLGWVQEGQLAEELERVLVSMEPETISDPIQSASGYHILYLLEKRAVSQDTMPSREGMQNTIGMQRLERQQRRYMQDLKTRAFIDTRV